MILYSGTMKLFMAPSMVNNMGELGLEAATIWIGLIELGVMVLYWIPLTSNLGFCQRLPGRYHRGGADDGQPGCRVNAGHRFLHRHFPAQTFSIRPQLLIFLIALAFGS
jgi:hypothetical protein